MAGFVSHPSGADLRSIFSTLRPTCLEAPEIRKDRVAEAHIGNLGSKAGLFVFRRLPGRCARRGSLLAQQDLEVLRVEREVAGGLLLGGAEHDVHAPVVGEHDGVPALHELLAVGIGKVGIILDELPDFRLAQVLILAVRHGLQGGGGDSPGP